MTATNSRGLHGKLEKAGDRIFVWRLSDLLDPRGNKEEISGEKKAGYI